MLGNRQGVAVRGNVLTRPMSARSTLNSNKTSPHPTQPAAEHLPKAISLICPKLDSPPRTGSAGDVRNLEGLVCTKAAVLVIHHSPTPGTFDELMEGS